MTSRALEFKKVGEGDDRDISKTPQREESYNFMDVPLASGIKAVVEEHFKREGNINLKEDIPDGIFSEGLNRK